MQKNLQIWPTEDGEDKNFMDRGIGNMYIDYGSDTDGPDGEEDYREISEIRRSPTER